MTMNQALRIPARQGDYHLAGKAQPADEAHPDKDSDLETTPSNILRQQLHLINIPRNSDFSSLGLPLSLLLPVG